MNSILYTMTSHDGREYADAYGCMNIDWASPRRNWPGSSTSDPQWDKRMLVLNPSWVIGDHRHFKETNAHHHWGQPREATVVKMAPARPLASSSFCLLAPLCDHRSLSNLPQSNTGAWYTLHQNGILVPFLVFAQLSPKDWPRDDGRLNAGTTVA